MKAALQVAILMVVSAPAGISAKVPEPENVGRVLVESLFKGGGSEGWRGANDGELQRILRERRGEISEEGSREPEKSRPEGGKNADFASATHITLSEEHGDGKTLYFQAPGRFTGDLGAAVGGHLTFGIRQSKKTGIEKEWPLVVLMSKEMILFYFPDKQPSPVWERVIVPLAEAPGWFNVTSGKQVPATKADFESVLRKVTELWIRAEYGTGPDRADIAEVRIHRPVEER